MSTLRKIIKQVCIGDFCQTGSGGTPSRSKAARYFGGQIPWVKSGELRETIITKTKETITEEGLKESAAKLLPANALLVALYGATVGRIGILGIQAATNQAVCYIIPDENRANQRYLYYALQSKVPFWLSKRVGGGQPNISQGIIKDTKIPLPPLSEQKRIADILDKADAIRRKRQETVDLSGRFLKSEFIRRFGNSSDSPFAIVSLNEVCEKITDGAHRTPTYVNSGVPFLRVTDIHNSTIDWRRVKYIPHSEHEDLIKRCNPELGDVLYSKNGTIGIPKYIDWHQPFSIFVSLALLKPIKDRLHGRFLESFLQTPFALKQATAHSKTLTVTNLHLVEIRKICLPLPPLSLQNEWVEFSDYFNKKREHLVKASAESDDLFNSLVQRAFKGEL